MPVPDPRRADLAHWQPPAEPGPSPHCLKKPAAVSGRRATGARATDSVTGSPVPPAWSELEATSQWRFRYASSNRRTQTFVERPWQKVAKNSTLCPTVSLGPPAAAAPAPSGPADLGPGRRGCRRRIGATQVRRAGRHRDGPDCLETSRALSVRPLIMIGAYDRGRLAGGYR